MPSKASPRRLGYFAAEQALEDLLGDIHHAAAIAGLLDPKDHDMVAADAAAWLYGEPRLRLPCRTVTAAGEVLPTDKIVVPGAWVAGRHGKPKRYRDSYLYEKPPPRHHLTWTALGARIAVRSHGAGDPAAHATLAALTGLAPLCVLAMLEATGNRSLPHRRVFTDRLPLERTAVHAIRAARAHLTSSNREG